MKNVIINASLTNDKSGKVYSLEKVDYDSKLGKADVQKNDLGSPYMYQSRKHHDVVYSPGVGLKSQ